MRKRRVLMAGVPGHGKAGGPAGAASFFRTCAQVLNRFGPRAAGLPKPRRRQVLRSPRLGIPKAKELLRPESGSGALPAGTTGGGAWNVLALLGAVVGVACLSPGLRASPPPGRIEHDFALDPFASGWQRSGEVSLFRWDAEGGNLAVTWDSAKPNSYCYLPLGTFLTREDDFRLEFSFTLDDIAIGMNEGKPYTFQIAVGLINVLQATGAGFRRGTGMDSPNLVEWDYFPDSGFGATVAAAMVSESNGWATSFNPAYELESGGTYGFVLDYRAANQQMGVEMLRGDQRIVLAAAQIREPFGDFAVDALAISSYSDEGQDPSFAGSVLAHGRIDRITLELPPPPIRRFRGGLDQGVWHAEFTGWSDWRYTLERSNDLRTWNVVGEAVDGTGHRQELTDAQPAPDQAYYRLRASDR